MEYSLKFSSPLNCALTTESIEIITTPTAQITYKMVGTTPPCKFVKNLENVRIGVMEEKNKPISGTDLGSVIARGVSETDKEISVVVWLDADTTKTIKGAKINITLEIIAK